MLEAYKLWHVWHNDFPRLSKYSLGSKIDDLFTDVIEALYLAGYTSFEQKGLLLINASTKLDLLKFFLQIAWEMKCLDHKKFAAISAPLYEVGKMLGGWQKQTQNKNSPTQGR